MRPGQKSGLAAAMIALAILGSLDQAGADIMLSNVQFELNMLNPDKIRWLFPGMEDMEIFYYRCQI
jgi:hypothetical protein